ncbi:MAG: futalosine hydrolase [Bacteroidales bacterium]
MDILIVTATHPEMEALRTDLLSDNLKKKGIRFIPLVTQPGILCTAYHLGAFFARQKVDLAINAGIAGAFSKSYELGSVVQVEREILADLGAQDGNSFLTAFDIGLFQHNDFPFSNGELLNPNIFKNAKLMELQVVKGITVNTVHGNDGSIQDVIRQFQPDVESMEGAAFFYASLINNVPFLEVRAISNYVEKRDRSKWKIEQSLNNLGLTVRNILLGF